MSERQIDDAIDAAVRDLMNVDAKPAFRVRVVERLRQPKPRGSLWRHVSVAAAALAVIIAVVVLRDGTKPAGQPRNASTGVPAVATAQTASSAEPRPTPAAVAAPTAPGRRHAVQRAVPATTHTIERGAIVATVADVNGSAADESAVAGAFESQDAIASIELTPITHTAIVTPEVAIAPLASPSEIVIAPLDPRRERN